MSITLKVKKPVITMNLDNTANLSFIVHKSFIEQLECLKTEDLSIEIKEYHEKRTKSQNAYFWKLITLLAEKYGDKPENIYRLFVRDYGVRDYILIQDKAVEKMTKLWASKGLGWFVSVLRQGKIDGTTTLIVYYGSSSYNRVEMARLIEPVIAECEKVGIPTIPKSEFMGLQNENE